MVCFTQTAFAAANPFSDVPAGHWAYDAVAQLAADGVIEGYGDETYRGDRLITRYEMAKMVAKAMNQNPTGVDKITIEKLAAELAVELNNLGARVIELEKHSDAVQWEGELRYFYKSDRNEGERKEDLNQAELRLYPTAEVNDQWKVKARLTGEIDTAADSSKDVKLTYSYAEGEYDNFKVNVGKMPLYSTNDDGLVVDDYFSGAQLTLGNTVEGVLEAGRWDMTNGNGINEDFSSDKTANYLGVQVNYNGDKLFAGLGYRHFGSDDFGTAEGYSTSEDTDSANVWSLGVNYSFDKNISLSASYAKNTSADAYDHSWTTQLTYKGADKTQPGSWGAYAAYRYISQNVSFAPTYDTMYSENHRKGFEVGVEYALMKNAKAEVLYFQGKKLDTNQNTSTIYGMVRLFI